MSNKFVIKPKLHGSGFEKAGNTGLKSWQAINEIIANSVDEWIKLFDEVGYTGDFYWFIP